MPATAEGMRHPHVDLVWADVTSFPEKSAQAILGFTDLALADLNTAFGFSQSPGTVPAAPGTPVSIPK